MATYNIYFLIAAVICNYLGQITEQHRQIYRRIVSQFIIIQFCLGFVQVASGSSLGLMLLGEASLSLEIAGVSKVSVIGLEFLRAYGTFAHPNILGAYGVFFLRTFRSKFLNILSFSLNANLAQILAPKFAWKFLLFPLAVLLIKNPFSNMRSYSDRIHEYSGANLQIEFQPVHNIFIELFQSNILILLGLVCILWHIYRHNRYVAVSLCVLGVFDHFLVSHPQGIMLWAVWPLILRTENT